jgi:DNA-directed RNA polymerase subunit RPC12/RpoP
MSYRLIRKKFKCLNCKTTFSMLVQNEDSTVHCKEVVKIVIYKQVRTAGKEEHRRNLR